MVDFQALQELLKVLGVDQQAPEPLGPRGRYVLRCGHTLLVDNVLLEQVRLQVYALITIGYRLRGGGENQISVSVRRFGRRQICGFPVPPGILA